MDKKDSFGIRVVVGAIALIPSTALAQAVAPAPAAAPEAPEAAPAPVSAPEAAPVEAVPSEPAVAPAPAPEPAPLPPPVEATSAEPEKPAEEAAPAEDPLQFSLFADAYWTYQTAKSGSPATRSLHRAYAGQGPTGLAENGFSLSWLGLDASYSTEHFGATASLRFGSSVPKFHGNDYTFGIDNILQGYATWKPLDGLALDLGQFGTIFGAEVAESWQNLNYTRGALYFYGQPFWHTGLRVGYQVSDMIKLTGMVVNGTNNISETFFSTPEPDEVQGGDQSPTLALQVGVSNETFLLAAGGMWAVDPEENHDYGFDQFYDLVGTLSLGSLSVIVNADYKITKGLEGADSTAFFGVSGAVGYAFTDYFGLALRGEYLRDEANYDEGDKSKWNLLTGTATIDVKPVPNTPNVILRWDNRIERSNQRVFFNGDGEPSKNWFASVVGLVVTSAP